MQILAYQSSSRLSPRRLILEMLDAEPDRMANGRRLVAAGSVFRFSENQVRVALSRLVADGLLLQPRRGDYALSGAATAIQQEIRHWRDIEQRLQRWRGDWCGVLTDNLAAEGSTQFRTQSRALALRGLQRWRPGLWVRPNNLRGGPVQLGEELVTLGLDAMKGQCVIAQGDESCEVSLRGLWNNADLEHEYQRRIVQLLEAGERLEKPEFPAVLIETIELGGDTIRALLKDPLLPDQIASGDSRRQLIRLLKQYDKRGRRQWQLFIQKL
jgi:phenylacetic acid degradation operon negative regulatory protein